MAAIVSGSIIVLLALAPAAAAAADCDVLDFSPFEDVRMTRTEPGLLLQQLQKCAKVTFRNTGFRGRYVTSYRFKALFADGSSEETWVELERNADRFRRLEPGETFTARACFGHSEADIAAVECE
ncbi:MAG: hypothetical protein PVG55_02125 [Nitrospirota bacterium]|jgi:hypothetical protein